MEQVVEALAAWRGQGGDRAQGPWGDLARLTPPGASRVAISREEDQRADSKLGVGDPTYLTTCSSLLACSSACSRLRMITS